MPLSFRIIRATEISKGQKICAVRPKCSVKLCQCINEPYKTFTAPYLCFICSFDLQALFFHVRTGNDNAAAVAIAIAIAVAVAAAAAFLISAHTGNGGKRQKDKRK